MIRPEVQAQLHRFREPLAALVVALVGVWVATRGGWFLGAIGLALVALCVGWGVTALRRLRFAQPVQSPGVVELIEGRIGYFGAGTALGGYVALDDLAEIRLITLRSARYWRLKTRDGQALLIPLGASGAAVLHDAFAALPGIDMHRIAVALDTPMVAQSLWVRPGRTGPAALP